MFFTHCFLSCFKRPHCTSKTLHLREPLSVRPRCEAGLLLLPEAELLNGRSLGLSLPTDSRFHQPTQAAVGSPKLQADFPCAARSHIAE